MRRKIGDIDMTALSDGPFPATLDTLIDFDRDEAQRLLGKPAGTPFFLPVNSYLLTLGSKRVLIDTGCGPTMGPELGQLPNRSARGRCRAGRDRRCPAHAYPSGSCDGAGRRQRRRDLSQCGADRARGRSEFLARPRAGRGRDRAHPPQYRQGRHATAPYRERMRTVRDGEALPGVSAMLLPGHTPGHTGWIIHSGARQRC